MSDIIMKTLTIGENKYIIVDAGARALIGNLTNLDTTAKSDLVTAINEVLAGSAVTPQAIQDAVDDYLDEHPALTGMFTNAAKEALLNLLEKVAYIDQNGQAYLDNLRALLAATVTGISAVFTQGQNVVYDVDSLESLKQYLVVTATYSDASTETLLDDSYTLSGTLEAGTSTITVTYAGQTDTFDVTVTGVTYLFNEGDECTALTGGWTNTLGFNIASIGSPSAINTGNALQLKFASANSSKTGACSLSTVNAIDVSNYSKLVVEYECGGGSSGTNSSWIYLPATIANSNTQAGAYGSDYAQHRMHIANIASAVATGKKERDFAASESQVHISFNLNSYSGFPANVYIKLTKVYLK